MHIWAFGLSCETLAAPPDRGAGARTRQPENSKRAHFRAPALQNTTKIPREDPQRDTERAKRWREREEKERNFGQSGGRVRWRGGPAEEVVQGSPNQQQPQQPRTTTPNPEQLGPRRAGPLSQARFKVFRGWAQQHTTTHNNTTTQQQLKPTTTPEFRQNTETPFGQSRSKLYQNTKIGQSRFGQSRSRPRLAKIGRKFGQSRFGLSRPKSAIVSPSPRPQTDFFSRKIEEKSARSTNCAPASPCQSKAEILFHIGGQWRGPVSPSHPRQLEHRCCKGPSDSTRQNGAPPQPPRLIRPPPHQRGLSSGFGAAN